MPPDVRGELLAQLGPYRRAHRDVRWTQPETWHLTLLFLGSVAPDRVPEVARLMRHVGQRAAPYPVFVDRGDGRVRGGAGVAWLSLSTGAGRLIELATLAARGCPPDITEGAPPRRTPSAHLTLVRKADRAVVQALRAQAHGPLGIGWTVDRLLLVRSHLGTEGARYETLREVTL